MLVNHNTRLCALCILCQLHVNSIVPFLLVINVIVSTNCLWNLMNLSYKILLIKYASSLHTYYT